MSTDLDRFYDLIERLAELPGQGRTFAEYSGRDPWPARGVYFFREPGESRRSGKPRVVRVGTHAVSVNSKTTLWGRLRDHRGHLDLGGNHRGSIFRLHVGSALLVRDRAILRELPTWASRQSATREVREKEVDHERRVSRYIGATSLLWVDVSDDPGPQSKRAFIERNAIALLSNRLSPHDPPSMKWLGLHSSRREIRDSGLWNMNHVNDTYESTFLEVLVDAIDRMTDSQQD